jgi:rfaE bifunctional protein nucleotidyltransferase chain/domain
VGQIISQDNLILRREKWKGNGQCVVFVSGTFDLLHPGHVRLLEQARSHGDVLVVGVKSDGSFRNHPQKNDSEKNDPEKFGVNRSRPVTPSAERAEILASLASVDIVVEYEDLSTASLIARLAPDIIVEGGVPPAAAQGQGQGQGTEVTEEATREKQTPKVVRIILEPGYSTTRIIERIQQVSA